MLSNKNLGIAVTAVAVVAGLMIGVAGPGRAQDKAPDKDKPAAAKACPPDCNWKDNNEYEEALAATKETTPAGTLAKLEKWKMDYPATDPQVLIIRQDMFLVAYTKLMQARQAFDLAQGILKDRPNNFRSLIATVSMVMAIKPAPSAQDMDIAEKVATAMLDSPDTVFAAANKPSDMSDADWTAAKAQTKPFAEGVLFNIYVARKDDKRAVDDLTKLIRRDPTMAMASYTLGQAMMRILKAQNQPQDQPPAFYQIARAVAYDGPNALDTKTKQTISDYLKNAYTGFHGSAEGLDKVLAIAKANPFPPADFSIKSVVDIAKEEQAARQAEQDKDPLMFLWIHTIKDGLATKGDTFFDDVVKEVGFPPEDGSFFKATIISMTPNPKPTEILVGIEKPDVADAKLVFEKPLEGMMNAGEMIQFKGQAIAYTKDPVVQVTFKILERETDLVGWTGKNPVAPKGAAKGTGAAKAAAPGAKSTKKQP